MGEPGRNEAGTRRPLREPQAARSGRADQGLAPHDRAAGRRLTTASSSPRWGALPPRRGLVLVVISAVVGTVITVLSGNDPGLALGLCIILGTVAACLAVRPRGVYWIIPAPALVYLAGAVVAGLIHDWTADSSRAVLAINAARWVASGFLSMVAATAVAVVLAAARWQLSRNRSADRQPPGQQRADPRSPGRQPPMRNDQVNWW